MARSRCESHHSDGITGQKNPQRTSATKSAKSRHSAPPANNAYSITSSAVASNEGEIVMPRAFAVFGERLGLRIEVVEARSLDLLPKAFMTAAGAGIKAMMINQEGLFFCRKRAISPVSVGASDGDLRMVF